MTEQNFWKVKSLSAMSDQEWESLCDGCARCCLVKLQDEETDKIYLTNIACQLLDIEHCRCTDYSARFKKVPMCMNLKTDLAEMVDYLPETCAYRLLFHEQALPEWHPLLNSSTDSVHQADISVAEFAVAEQAIHPEQIEQHIIACISDGEGESDNEHG